VFGQSVSEVVHREFSGYFWVLDCELSHVLMLHLA